MTAALFNHAQDRKTVPAGQAIFRMGDAGTHMYGVVSGEVALQLDEQTVATIGPGGVFGELAIIDDSPRSLDAVAATDATIAAIDRRLFLFLIHETPTFALDVMQSMAARLRTLTS